jgi:decaprenyl-phosphate phosphoribosyltransferase
MVGVVQGTGRGGVWIRAVRVRQWAKNLLVFAAPAAAGALGRPRVLLCTLVALVVFCLLASGVYLLNDLSDVAEDRLHPVKRHRPIAAGLVSPSSALVVAAAAFGLAAALSVAVSWNLLWLAAGYVALNVSYTRWLRGVAIADICAIAAAFVLRASAGGVAADIPISRLLIVVVSFAALFVAAGKRYADFIDPAARGSRPVLEAYNADFLRMVLGVASAVALGSYCLWALGATPAGNLISRELTIVPFTLAMLRYGLLITAGSGAAPEEILFGDRFIQVVGAAWLVLFASGT